MTRTSKIFAFLASIVSLAAAGAEQTQIASVVADSKLQVLTIRGSHLVSPKGTRVFLRGYPTALPMLAVDDSLVRAQLPAAIAPGSYLLTVHGQSAEMAKLVLRTPKPASVAVAGRK